MRAGCSLRFIADESLDGPIIERLRADGHDVVSIAELKPGIEDVDVLSISVSERAVLITADKDFGELVFRQGLKHTGIILVRLAGLNPQEKAVIASESIGKHAETLGTGYAVLSKNLFRVRKVG